MGWLDDVMKATSHAETPHSFIKWGALSAISAVSAPHVFLDRGGLYKVSPNTYVMLLARSGLGKGFPIWMAKALVEDVKCTRVISGRNSIQSVLKDLGSSHTTKDSNTPVFRDSRGFLVSGEFADFITYDPHALIILTDLYDTHYNSTWKNTTKGQGVDSLVKPCLTMFGASSPVHFKSVVPESSIGGGFIGRTLLVYEDKRSRNNSFIEAPEHPFNVGDLSKYLRGVANVKGEFVWSPDGAKLFDKWHTSIREADTGQDDTGTYERLPDHVLKVSMLLQMAYDYETLVLYPDVIDEAIDLVEELGKNAKKNMMLEGKSSSKEHVTVVLRHLMKKSDFMMSRKILLQRAWGHVNSNELDLAITTLNQMDYVEEISKGSETHYRLTPKAIQFFINETKSDNGTRH